MWQERFFASAALAIVKIPRLEKKETREETMTGQIREGLEVFRQDKKMFYLVMAEAGCMFFYAPLSSFYPLMTSDYFGLSAMYGSIVEIAFAGGMMLASLLFSSVLKIENKIKVSFLGLLGMGTVTAVCGMIPPVYAGWFVFAAACVFLGASGNVHTIPLTAYIQETVTAEENGAGLFGPYADLIGDNAGGAFDQQSHCRTGGSKCVVFPVRDWHDFPDSTDPAWFSDTMPKGGEEN